MQLLHPSRRYGHSRSLLSTHDWWPVCFFSYVTCSPSEDWSWPIAQFALLPPRWWRPVIASRTFHFSFVNSGLMSFIGIANRKNCSWNIKLFMGKCRLPQLLSIYAHLSLLNKSLRETIAALMTWILAKTKISGAKLSHAAALSLKRNRQT